ncbi:MAG: hypothetical protein R6T98_03395 [Desulfatiglandales bacterium]
MQNLSIFLLRIEGVDFSELITHKIAFHFPHEQMVYGPAYREKAWEEISIDVLISYSRSSGLTELSTEEP